MVNTELSALKLLFYQSCLNALNLKSTELKTEVEQLRLSIANDSKSSMGDKYETSREMMQQEINRLEQQIALNAQQLFALKATIIDKKYATVEKGCLVETNMGLFFISVSFGEVKVGNSSCFMLSEFAPLAKSLLKKRVGDEFEINRRSVKIISLN